MTNTHPEPSNLAVQPVEAAPDTAQPDAPTADDVYTAPLARYDHALYGIGKPWRGILAIVTFVASFLLLSLVLGALAIIIDLLTGTIEPDSLNGGEITMTPMLMLFNNLSLAALIPLSFLLQRLFFGVRMGTLASVVGHFRWRWFGRLALIIVPVWIIYVGISFLFEPTGEIRLDASIIAMVVIVLLTTPLQSAGEEFGARGLIQRSAGSWFRHPLVAFIAGTVLSSALFAIAHFAADPWLIAYYFVFAISASLAARGTGGLEAPVLVHAINNVLLLLPVALSGQMSESFDRSDGAGGPVLLIPMALCLAAAGFSTWWGRRSGIAARAPRPQKIRRPGPVQYAHAQYAPAQYAFGQFPPPQVPPIQHPPIPPQ